MVVINQLLVSPINMNKNNQRNATEFDGLFFFFFYCHDGVVYTYTFYRSNNSK